MLNVDNIVVCVGQVPFNILGEKLTAAGVKVHVIGGALNAKELDAKRAIKEAWEAAVSI